MMKAPNNEEECTAVESTYVCDNPYLTAPCEIERRRLTSSDLANINPLLFAFRAKLWMMHCEELRETIFDKGIRSGPAGKRRLQILSQLRPLRHNMCHQACEAFTGPRSDKQVPLCRHCNIPRFDGRGEPLRHFETIPLAPRLQAQYANPPKAANLRLSHILTQPTTVDFVFDG